jgi:hypothetical protein
VARRGRNRVDRALSGAERRVRRGASWRRQPCPRCTRSGPGRFSFACSMVRATGIPRVDARRIFGRAPQATLESLGGCPRSVDGLDRHLSTLERRLSSRKTDGI